MEELVTFTIVKSYKWYAKEFTMEYKPHYVRFHIKYVVCEFGFTNNPVYEEEAEAYAFNGEEFEMMRSWADAIRFFFYNRITGEC